MLQAAPDPELEALKQELLELKQRYEVQQKALAVLEQRVRQVEEQPAAPPPKRLAKSPADLKGNPNVATGTGAGGDIWIALEVRWRLGQAFGRRRSGLFFDLTDPLFEHRQGFLLYFVSLLQLQKLLFESLQFRVRCCLQHRRRE